jgi:hypothetical protein
MKSLILFVAALFMLLIFLSCKKDTDSVLPVEGNWVGLYGNDNEVPSIFYKLNIKHGGVIEELNASGDVKGSGNWTLKGNNFTAHYQWKAPHNTFFTITARIDPNSNKLVGTWGFDNSATDGGKWEAIKEN